MVAPTNGKNRLTFDGSPVTDTDFGSLFRFPRNCGIRDCWLFIHAVTGRFSRNSAKWLTPTFWDRSGGSESIRKCGYESRITFGWGNQTTKVVLAEVCSVRLLSSQPIDLSQTMMSDIFVHHLYTRVYDLPKKHCVNASSARRCENDCFGFFLFVHFRYSINFLLN